MSFFDKKYQVFISSTYEDLISARDEVIKVILSLYQIPIGMEMFSADNSEQWDIIKTTIENSDYYILIIGHRYGSETIEKISYTEKEFNYAKELGIPIIAFIRKRDIATTPNQRDSDSSKIDKLHLFLEKVTKNAMCDFWENENELAQKVAVSFTKQIFKTPRIGWIRANESSMETASELTKLIQENRELRDENQKLKANNSNEKPNLIIRFNNESLNLTNKNVFDRSLKKLEYKNIPIDYQGNISEEEVNTFNDSIDKYKEEIDCYNDSYNIYKNAKNNSIELAVQILNEGSRKANDIHIDIQFPPEILIFEKEDIDELELPKKIKVIENPINRVMKLESDVNIAAFGLKFPVNDYNSFKPAISNIYARSLNINKNNWIDKDKNTLLIKLKSLLQTRNITIKDNIFIVAKEKGTFKILINVICDEYKTSDSQTITINVD